MELTVFSIRIDAGRQFIDKLSVEQSPDKSFIKNFSVHTGYDRLEAQIDKRLREIAFCPDGENAFHSHLCQVALAIFLDLIQEYIAERYCRNTRLPGLQHYFFHPGFIFLVGAIFREEYFG